MGIREDRAAAIDKLCRLFGDDFRAAKAALLDDLDAIDDAHSEHPPAMPAQPASALTTEVTGPLKPATRRRART